jgi:hypothetical protein
MKLHDYQRDVKKNIVALNKKSSVLSSVVGEAEIPCGYYIDPVTGLCRKKKSVEKIFPNDLGFVAHAVGFEYSEIPFRDGSRGHCYPGKNGPGYLSQVKMKEMLFRDFERIEDVAETSYDIAIESSEPRANLENEDIVHAGFYIKFKGMIDFDSADVIGLDSDSRKIARSQWVFNDIEDAGHGLSFWRRK